MAYAFGFAIIKYQQGFIEFKGSIIPKPSSMWPEEQQRAIFPLMLVFSFGWSMEMTTHLEELCFWLFLVNAGSAQQDWFRSWYFRFWIVGSVVAIIYMPGITLLTRDDPLKCEAYSFLAGSLGSLSLTLWFTPVLWAFPAFLASLKNEGVDSATIVRLTKFHELNTIRVIFRFIFVIPFIILGVDGLKPHRHINESMLWTDFLTMTSAFGVSISSTLTLVIFFPRSVEGEIAAKDAAREQRRTGSHRNTHLVPFESYRESAVSEDSFVHAHGHHGTALKPAFSPSGKEWATDSEIELPTLPALRPQRRGQDVEMGVSTGSAPLTADNLSQHNLRPGNLNPLVHNFTSPIDLYG